MLRSAMQPRSLQTQITVYAIQKDDLLLVVYPAIAN